MRKMTRVDRKNVWRRVPGRVVTESGGNTGTWDGGIGGGMDGRMEEDVMKTESK